MQISDEKTFTKTIHIDASRSKLWEVLTRPGLMRQWLSDSALDIKTSWKIGSPITMLVAAESYKDCFENKGTVLQFEPERLLQYSHLSSLSKLHDHIENYTVITFLLAALDGKTTLTLTLNNFPTETIYQHLAFYWNITLELLKKLIEGNQLTE
ncbi:uncharacterized protein YndB with AHSA1/START domain [Pedobacter africanus]|uniref:Uncharacterized protein YndB with AHSA1/START domain n=1 Tax=Pedobacter africanus TaxID=151894 RepID=A0ACC6KYC3_9SPHI|nr:SRPBCC domain-containing protein [Pedobacter africanus]MDR6784359.1 uncharacterized protein YndB with AHSA1/START domain [Pedobacter africanus]